MLVGVDTASRTRRQANQTFVVGIRRRIPLGRSASMGTGRSAPISMAPILTGKNVDGVGDVEDESRGPACSNWPLHR